MHTLGFLGGRGGGGGGGGGFTAQGCIEQNNANH